jgi:molybdate/tungstate transport system substrate-binding protein
MKKNYVEIAAVAFVILLASTYFLVSNFSSNTPKQTLTVFCATSLEYPLNQVETDFEKAYPNVDLHVEGHGSIQVIRHVTELNFSVDVVLVADYSLIPTMMYSTKVSGTDQSFSDYYIKFATNTMVLAYTNSSKYANEINPDNWHSIIARSDVKIGLANPQLDALGYRALMMVQLAQDYYNDTNLFHNVITANLNPPINSIPNGSNYTITVPEVQTPTNNKLTLRASEVDLIGLLQVGYLDYCFIYLSNAKQYGFNFVTLPDEVNMGSAQQQSNYERIHVVYDHQRFSTVNLDRTGETTYYGLTIPANAPHPELAEEFIKFILEEQGKTDFETCYHPVFTPSYTDNLQAIPSSLKSLVTAEPQNS